jgi:REP element-mobilizing transposase RayT
MAYVKVLIHAVWGTKNRESVIAQHLRSEILLHIKENAASKEIFIDTLNSQPDHIHCLFYLNADMSVAKAINLIKGESSFWINKQKLLKAKFEWADEYFAASVSESQKDKVRAYILNQDEHHRKLSFAEEYNKFLESYGYTPHG